MELRFTPDEIAFRDEARAFIRASVPAAVRDKLKTGRLASKDEVIDWQRKLNAKGWAVPHWPREWGGTDWGPVKRYILREEIEQAPAPPVLVFGVHMVGPVIAAFGNEAQKRRFLPRIANLDDWFCQGFSEPGAGSDLASLRTTAKREGEHYRVNGQKIWTTMAHHADWIFCLVRTDPAAKKQEGISFLLIDMKSPGVTVRPIVTFDGLHEFNEVFFDDVVVPVENRVGEENKGWDYAKFLLNHERTGIARVGQVKQRIRFLKHLAINAPPDGRVRPPGDGFWTRVAALEVRIKAHEITTLRALAAEQRHRVKGSDPAASVIKICSAEILQGVAELYLELSGTGGLRAAPIEADPLDWVGMGFANYVTSRKFSILGGTSEIQKNILAKLAMDL